MFDIKFIDFVYYTLSPLPTTPVIYSPTFHTAFRAELNEKARKIHNSNVFMYSSHPNSNKIRKIRHECLISITLLLSSHPARKNGNASAGSQVRIDSEHNLQEYTYKKITPCDVCSQVLRGECRVDLVMSRIKCLFTFGRPFRGEVLIIFNK